MSGPGDAGRDARLVAAEDALQAVLAHDAEALSWGCEDSIRETLQWIERARRGDMRGHWYAR